jgi:hypothetical protein
MLLKVSLIVAILASIATLVLSHLKVANSITGLKTELQTTQGDLARANEDAATARKKQKTAEEQTAQTGKELEDTKALLETASSKAKEQQERADKHEADWKKVLGQFNDAQRELAQWGALDVPVEQVRNRLAELVKSKEANEALNAENAVFSRNIATLKAELAKYMPEKETVPPLPPGLKGTVLAVDPKWDFVVLDIGSDKGVIERGEMLVNREGKLVAKVRITSVEATRCIANVLPEWKQDEVKAGDIVLY